jgi:hypothetical protein
MLAPIHLYTAPPKGTIPSIASGCPPSFLFYLITILFCMLSKREMHSYIIVKVKEGELGWIKNNNK